MSETACQNEKGCHQFIHGKAKLSSYIFSLLEFIIYLHYSFHIVILMNADTMSHVSVCCIHCTADNLSLVGEHSSEVCHIHVSCLCSEEKEMSPLSLSLSSLY